VRVVLWVKPGHVYLLDFVEALNALEDDSSTFDY